MNLIDIPQIDPPTLLSPSKEIVDDLVNNFLTFLIDYDTKFMSKELTIKKIEQLLNDLTYDGYYELLFYPFWAFNTTQEASFTEILIGLTIGELSFPRPGSKKSKGNANKERIRDVAAILLAKALLIHFSEA